MVDYEELPRKICLEDYGGNYRAYIDAVYEVFERDFIIHKTTFGSHRLSLKYHPEFQERAYTFYHMTHKGERERLKMTGSRICDGVNACLGLALQLKKYKSGN